MVVVRRLAFQMYPTQSLSEEETIWKKECVKAIDSKNRKVRITPRSNKGLNQQMPNMPTTSAATAAAEAYTKYLNHLNPSQLGQSQQLPQHLSHAASTAAIAAIAAAAMAAAANKPSLDTQNPNIARNLTSPSPSPTNPKSEPPH